MPKIDSIFDIQGTMKGMTFYKSKVNGSLVRAKGGVSKKRIMNDPAFARTRENGTEFKSVAQDGQLIRKSTGVFYKLAKDSHVVSRLVKVLSEVKKLDLTSVRGERIVVNGLSTDSGKVLLKGFEFNQKSVLNYVLRSGYDWDPVTANFNMPQFISNEHLNYPDETTHVNFGLAVSRLDFESKQFDTVYSEPQQIAMSNTATPIQLIPESIPQGDGFLFYFLMIEFKQEINGVLYPLKNNAYNVLHILDVRV